MVDWTKSPYDKISHVGIELTLTGLTLAIGLMAGWEWTLPFAAATRWYFREQAQEWHMCHRCRDAYFPWRWRKDSLMDALVPVIVVSLLTIITF